MSESFACPACRSTLLHPQRLRRGQPPLTTVDLRCAECGAWTHVACSPVELARLDAERSDGRRALVQAYERSVSESMEALADCLGAALQRDLVGADDFAPRRGG